MQMLQHLIAKKSGPKNIYKMYVITKQTKCLKNASSSSNHQRKKNQHKHTRINIIYL